MAQNLSYIFALCQDMAHFAERDIAYVEQRDLMQNQPNMKSVLQVKSI